MLALVDCNSCYASCHQIFRPDLRGRPVVVLSNNDGCIVARSKEAKALGIPDLQPFFKIESLLAQHQVTVFSSNYALYGDISNRVMKTLRGFSPEIEVYSIDEMFLNLKGISGDLNYYGHEMKTTLWQHIRMPVGVGIASTKTLAKLANRAAKKIPKCQGVCVLDSEIKRHWLMKHTPLTGLWGIARRTAKRLESLGIHSAYDLARADAKYVRRHTSVNVERTIEELNGIACFDLETQPPDKQRIYCTRSFGDKPESIEPILEAIALYCARACEKLRAQNHWARAVHVFMHTSPYESNYYSNSMVVQLPYASDNTGLITQYARQAAKRIYQSGHRYLKAGIGLLDLVSRDHAQFDLFQCHQPERSDQLMQALDQVNSKYGRGTLHLCAEGIHKKWAMRQNFKSPAYTTRWSDIPQVKML